MITVDEQYRQFTLNPGEYGTRKAPARQVIWVDDPDSIDIPRGEIAAGADTETEPIVKGEPAVRVLTQVDYPRNCVTHLVPWPHDDRYIERVLTERPDMSLAFLNIGFDFRVLGELDNEPLTQALMDGRLWDTGLRFCLARLERGEFTDRWSLDYLAERILGWKLPKDNEVRTGYRRNMRMTEKFVRYAAMDAVATAEIAATLPDQKPSENIQNLGSVMLDQMGHNGFPVDKAYFYVLREKLTRKRDRYLQLLDLFGYRPGESGNTRVIQDRLRDIEKYMGVELPRTEKTNELSLSEKALSEMDYTIEHPFIEAFNRYSHYNKMLTNYLKEDNIGVDGKVHSFFNPMARTGRTTSSGPNVQNPSKKDGIRQVYVPEPYPCPEEPPDSGSGTYDPGVIQVPDRNWLLLAVDVKQAELCSMAEHCYLDYGFSKMREYINSGYDLHQITASTYFNKPADQIFGRERNFGKIPNFGGLGMLGATSLVDHAKEYGIYDLTVDQATDLLQAWKDSYPEVPLHLKPEIDEEFTGIEVEKYCREHGYEKTRKFDRLRSMVEDRLKDKLKAQEQGAEDIPEEEREEPDDSSVRYRAFMKIKDCQRYCSKLITGRVYRNQTGPGACNIKIQGPVGDAGKMAGFCLYYGGYKDTVVNFIHDEFIVRVRNDSYLQENIKRINELILQGFRKVIKHTDITLENQLMDRWWKEAEDVYDDQGNLKLWMPSRVTRDIAFRYPDAEVIKDPDDDATDTAADNVAELMEFIS